MHHIYMIKETNASIDVDLLIKFVIEVDGDLNVGFIGLSVQASSTRFVHF